jgi:hypothetical protein
LPRARSFNDRHSLCRRRSRWTSPESVQRNLIPAPSFQGARRANPEPRGLCSVSGVRFSSTSRELKGLPGKLARWVSDGAQPPGFRVRPSAAPE